MVIRAFTHVHNFTSCSFVGTALEGMYGQSFQVVIPQNVAGSWYSGSSLPSLPVLHLAADVATEGLKSSAWKAEEMQGTSC